ncbi:probable glutathione S-transferase 6 isoform X1 [Hydractinia symbiolongicarpus]|uniref:probable glutathione S-transferase 6 isoform X1 n=1 Tax=Hydractinia symbiolongicarpus TaxID=13093 RepID=UPI002550E358|nr:probable glutathione S-transferase 6 isoform X1 [Hydractinia symbiolongicarpus]
MSKKYVLNYFPSGGRAELARFLFLVAGVEFTDNHISKEEWPKVKNDTKKFPLNQLPTLEVDGRVICQSKAIYRYLASEFNLYGANNDEASIIDQVGATLFEFVEQLAKIHFNPALSEDEKKSQILEVYAKDSTKRYFDYLSEIFKANGTGYFVGDKVRLLWLILSSFPSAVWFSNLTQHFWNLTQN